MQNFSKITQNTELSCESVKVFGDIHSGSILDAHTLSVKGLTHPNTTLLSKYAHIHEHQASLRCHEAHIDICSGGEVHASSVSITKCTGGTIYAQDVYIKELTSDIHIYAANSITIESITGANNTLCIDYTQVPILLSKIERIQEDIDELEFLRDKARTDNNPAQKHIEHELLELSKGLDSIHNSSKTAKISITHTLKENNFISFRIDTQHALHYTTTQLQYPPFYLEFSKNTISLHPTRITITL